MEVSTWLMDVLIIVRIQILANFKRLKTDCISNPFKITFLYFTESEVVITILKFVHEL